MARRSRRRSSSSSSGGGIGRGISFQHIALGSVIIGLVGGIAISHVFHSQVNSVWSHVPIINKFPEY
jgi:hypothetical protein